MLRRGNVIYQYYSGYDLIPIIPTDGPRTKISGTVMETRQRLDGFVSVDAGSDGGRFVTPVLVYSGRRLTLNLDVSAAGDIRVELQDQTGHPYRGYSFAESDPMDCKRCGGGGDLCHGDSDVASVAGKPLRIAFKLRTAKLFAFQFAE